MFKIGDRVRIICPIEKWNGKIGTIVDIWSVFDVNYNYNEDRYGVQFDQYYIGFGKDELELIRQPDNKPLPLPG